MSYYRNCRQDLGLGPYAVQGFSTNFFRLKNVDQSESCGPLSPYCGPYFGRQNTPSINEFIDCCDLSRPPLAEAVSINWFSLFSVFGLRRDAINFVALINICRVPKLRSYLVIYNQPHYYYQ